MPKRRASVSARLTPITLTALSSLYAYMYCMMTSNALAAMPILGGVFFMCGQVVLVLADIWFPAFRQYLPKKLRVAAAVFCGSFLLLNFAFLYAFPTRAESERVWVLFGLILSITLRAMYGKRIIRRCALRQMPEKRFVRLYAFPHLLCIAAAAALLLSIVSSPASWQLLGGYATVSALEAYSQLKDRAEQKLLLEPVSPKRYFLLRERIGKTNAFTSYEFLSACILAALEMTLVFMYTFLAVTGSQLLLCMVLCGFSTFLGLEAADLWLRFRERRRKTEPTSLLIIGLLLWMLGIALFGQNMKRGALQSLNAYFSLSLSSLGVSVCLSVLMRMERTMLQVARFSVGGEPEGYRQMRRAASELAFLCGQMMALFTLIVLAFSVKQYPLPSAADFSARFQPLVIIPAVLTVFGALLGALKFPLSQRYMDKLSRFLRLRQNGEENPALEEQLQRVVVKPHRQTFFINMLKAFLRPFYRFTLQGEEHIAEDPENPLVFLCNHGEFYGPLAAMLNIPVPVRPWTISEISVDKEEMSVYYYTYTIKKQRWIPECLKMPIARMVGPISVWAMSCLESIPVFRDKPRDLRNTFRMSVEAMQAGDNLLIFPENPNAAYRNHGYEREGLGELFSGFAMLAPIYYSKTGKCCRFLPAYAHQKIRTLSFGSEVVYNPDNDPQAERERLVTEISQAMLCMYETEEAKYRKAQTSTV